METILTPCRVPWSISPTTSGVTLTHSETSVEPECTVVLGAGRLRDDDRTDDRRIEITFRLCYYVRTCPHSDMEDIEDTGYRILQDDGLSGGDYIAKRHAIWRASGYCPESGFYVATQSQWLESVPEFFQDGFHHYVVYGRDGHVELIARSFRWREWLWPDGHREGAPSKGPIIAEDEGVA